MELQLGYSAEELLKTRKERRMSAEAVAHELGVSQTSVSQWERGERVPPLKRQIRIVEWIRGEPVVMAMLRAGSTPPPPDNAMKRRVERLYELLTSSTQGDVATAAKMIRWLDREGAISAKTLGLAVVEALARKEG